ncbi:hypothetical protein FRC01_014208 [Tulasnella sp. 417]|nr:hypothetical protein FRC01_014208 [Tulasnella sp. 417]
MSLFVFKFKLCWAPIGHTAFPPTPPHNSHAFCYSSSRTNHDLYSFDLPSGITSPPSSTSRSTTHTYSFDVQTGTAYYDSFLDTLKKAREVTGNGRDAVGDAEKNKEAAPQKPPSDEDDEDEDEGAE